jgi:hypothetical protein
VLFAMGGTHLMLIRKGTMICFSASVRIEDSAECVEDKLWAKGRHGV